MVISKIGDNNAIDNQGYLILLKQGVAVWNQWRQKHMPLRPDFNSDYCRGYSLVGAQLSYSNFHNNDLNSV